MIHNIPTNKIIVNISKVINHSESEIKERQS